MYLVYIRPLLEYACEVWDNCNKSSENKLENVQLQAARIITGLPLFTKKEYIYRELAWNTLKDRRTFRKLNLFYDIENHSAPEYLEFFFYLIELLIIHIII